MSFLSNLLSQDQPSSNAFYLLQSSAAQSALPLLKGLLSIQTKCTLILVCSLYAPSVLLSGVDGELKSKNKDLDLRIIEWTNEIPGYGSNVIDWKSRLEEIHTLIKESSRPVTVVIDSVDTIEEDLESPSETYKFLSQVFNAVNSCKASRLICHISALSSVLPFLKEPRFSSSLIHLTAHPPALLTYISQAYLTSPPPSTSATTTTSETPDSLKFWRVFAPLSDRPLEIEALVFGTDEQAEGGSTGDEFIVEVLVVVRGRRADLPIISSTHPIPGSGSSVKRKAGVERLLEGWSVLKGTPVPLEDLNSLKSIWRKKPRRNDKPDAPDPTKDLTFNLNLTDSQQASRSQVPLPYEHNGRGVPGKNNGAQIFYDPDSADDLDDEDPDEDLDL